MDATYEQVAKMIDHSLLNPVMTDEELESGCAVALEYDVASVCIKPYYLKRCAELLSASTGVLPWLPSLDASSTTTTSSSMDTSPSPRT